MKVIGSSGVSCSLRKKLSNPSLRYVLYRRRVLYILFIPSQVALITIAHVARTCDAVELIRIDHELGFDSQTSQSLVHLLTALHRNVEVALAAQEKCRRFDSIGVQEWIRNLLKGFPGFGIPGRTNLVIVLNDVLIRPVEGHGEGRAGAAGRSLETRVGRDDVVRQDSAITPTAHSQAIRIGNAHRDHMIDAGEQVFDFVMAPVSKDRAGILLTAA